MMKILMVLNLMEHNLKKALLHHVLLQHLFLKITPSTTPKVEAKNELQRQLEEGVVTSSPEPTSEDWDLGALDDVTANLSDSSFNLPSGSDDDVQKALRDITEAAGDTFDNKSSPTSADKSDKPDNDKSNDKPKESPRINVSDD